MSGGDVAYEDLSGGRGREIYFRAPRLRGRALARRGRVTVRLGGAQGTLADFSLSGVACHLSTAGESLSVGAQVPIDISVDEKSIFSATARVVRTQLVTRGTKVAVHLLDHFLDTKEAIHRTRDIEFGHELALGVDFYSAVPAEYVNAVASAAIVLSHWRAILTAREEELKVKFRSESDLLSSLQELAELAEPKIRRDWTIARARANDATERLGHDDQTRLAAQRLTSMLLMPLLMDSPSWKHGYAKPRGYPGDFEFMNMIYVQAPEGRSVFARVMHRLGCDERLAATVRDRRDYLVSQIMRSSKALLSAERALRIASIGAGPAREVEDFLTTGGDARPTSIDVTLIDQDEGALEFANERLRKAALEAGVALNLRCLHIAFRDLLASPALLAEMSGQDLIYASGFYDYLPQAVGAFLTKHLFSLVGAGGRMLIGNAADAPGIRWVPEFILDWRMIYRTPEQMRELAAGLGASAASSAVESDASAAWHFLVIDRA